jgi:hypothetical protein
MRQVFAVLSRKKRGRMAGRTVCSMIAGLRSTAMPLSNTNSILQPFLSTAKSQFQLYWFSGKWNFGVQK